MTDHHNWSYPNDLRVGSGRARELVAACRQVGMRRPLIVTAGPLAGADFVRRAVEEVTAGLDGCAVFDRVKSNPTGGNVADGLAVYRDGGHDGVVIIGGGSPIDAGKAIAFMAGQKHPLWDYEDNHPDRDRKVDPAGVAPSIVLPTTAGTGSEVGRASVITDEVGRVKRTIMHIRMLPRVAILDPELTVGMPPALTATTGADALTHCIESACSPVPHPMSKAVAIEGIRLIRDALPKVMADPSDLEARQQMLVASSMGAVAFQRGLGGVHAIAQSLGALYDRHHGLLNAIVLPYVLAANRPVVDEVATDIARWLRLETSSFTTLMDWLLDLRATIGLPHRLADIGIDDTEAELVGRMSVVDGCARTNPVAHSAEGYARIFRAAVSGDL